MRRLVLMLALIAWPATRAEGQVTYSDIIYRGCMPTDPLSCAELRFWFSGPEGFNMWIMDVPAFTGELGVNHYHIRDDMWVFRSFDGECVSGSYFWYRQADDCSVAYRYSGQWIGQAVVFDDETGETLRWEPVLFSATTTPEPTASSISPCFGPGNFQRTCPVARSTPNTLPLKAVTRIERSSSAVCRYIGLRLAYRMPARSVSVVRNRRRRVSRPKPRRHGPTVTNTGRVSKRASGS